MKRNVRLTRFATRTLVAGFISMGMAAATADETTPVVTTGDETVSDPVVTTSDDTVTDPVVETSSIGRSANVESKLSTEFADFLGSEENAAKVVEGLRTGKAFELDEAGPTDDTTETTTTGPVTTADTGTQDGGADTTADAPADLPTGTMGYGNVRLTLRLAQAEFDQLGLDRPATNDELSALLLGGEINGEQYAGILNERAAGAGWGEIAKRYDFKVGQIMGNAPAKQPTVETLPEPDVQETAATSTRSNGYIPSGKTRYTYRDSTGNAAPKSKSQGAKANGYIPSGKSPASGAGLVSGNGGGATHAKTNHGQAKGHTKGYVPSGGGQGLGIVSASNASTSAAAVNAAGGHGQGKGQAKGHGKSK